MWAEFGIDRTGLNMSFWENSLFGHRPGILSTSLAENACTRFQRIRDRGFSNTLRRIGCYIILHSFSFVLQLFCSRNLESVVKEPVYLLIQEQKRRVFQALSASNPIKFQDMSAFLKTMASTTSAASQLTSKDIRTALRVVQRDAEAAGVRLTMTGTKLDLTRRLVRIFGGNIELVVEEREEPDEEEVDAEQEQLEQEQRALEAVIYDEDGLGPQWEDDHAEDLVVEAMFIDGDITELRLGDEEDGDASAAPDFPASLALAFARRERKRIAAFFCEAIEFPDMVSDPSIINQLCPQGEGDGSHRVIKKSRSCPHWIIMNYVRHLRKHVRSCLRPCSWKLLLSSSTSAFRMER